MRKACALVMLLCSMAAQAVVIRDDRQQEVNIAKPPQRIVSLLPSLTETVCELGQCQKLVGVDRYSNWPDRHPDGRPRSANVVIRRLDGGEIGT